MRTNVAIRTTSTATALRRTASPLLAVSATVVVLAAFAGAGSADVWNLGNEWLRTGGFERVASVAAILMAASSLGTAFVARHVGPMSNTEFHEASRRRWRVIPHHAIGPTWRSPTPGEYLAENGLPATDAKVGDVAGLLATQLGPRLANAGNVLSWPLHLRCLVACLVESSRPDGSAGTWEHTSWLRTEATWDAPEKDLAQHAGAILERRWPEVTAKLAFHSHLRPAILRLCDEARAHGGLPSARLLWLRDVDVTLWRAAIDLGRPSCHAEALGVLAHYRMERLAGRPIPEPDLGAAAERLLAAVGLADPKA